MSEQADTPDPSKREFVRVVLLLGLGATCAGAGVFNLFSGTPDSGSTAIPIAPMAEVLKEMGRFDALSKVNKPLALEISISRRDAWRVRTRSQRIYLRRVKEGNAADCFQALSPICPHAGCSVEVHSDKQSFVCPCHEARFALDGACTDGPAPRGLDPLLLTVEVREGRPWLHVTWQDFVIGTEERRARA